MGGKCLSNRTSTTLPRMETTTPRFDELVLLFISSYTNSTSVQSYACARPGVSFSLYSISPGALGRVASGSTAIARSPLRQAGWAINDKRVEPIWRREGLSPASSPGAVGFGWPTDHVWHYGQEQHIGRFVSIDDAQSWITENAEGWLRNRTAALRSRDHQRPSRMMACVRE